MKKKDIQIDDDFAELDAKLKLWEKEYKSDKIFDTKLKKCEELMSKNLFEAQQQFFDIIEEYKSYNSYRHCAILELYNKFERQYRDINDIEAKKSFYEKLINVEYYFEDNLKSGFCHELAGLYYVQNQYTKAEFYLLESERYLNNHYNINTMKNNDINAYKLKEIDHDLEMSEFTFIYIHLALVRHKQHKNKQALLTLQKALKVINHLKMTNTNNNTVYYNKRFQYCTYLIVDKFYGFAYTQKKYDEAIEFIQSSEMEKDFRYYRYLSDAYLAKNDLENAKKACALLYRNAKNDHDNIDVILLLTKINLMENKFDEAENRLKRIIEQVSKIASSKSIEDIATKFLPELVIVFIMKQKEYSKSTTKEARETIDYKKFNSYSQEFYDYLCQVKKLLTTNHTDKEYLQICDNYISLFSIENAMSYTEIANTNINEYLKKNNIHLPEEEINDLKQTFRIMKKIGLDPKYTNCDRSVDLLTLNKMVEKYATLFPRLCFTNMSKKYRDIEKSIFDDDEKLDLKQLIKSTDSYINRFGLTIPFSDQLQRMADLKTKDKSILSDTAFSQYFYENTKKNNMSEIDANIAYAFIPILYYKIMQYKEYRNYSAHHGTTIDKTSVEKAFNLALFQENSIFKLMNKLWGEKFFTETAETNPTNSKKAKIHSSQKSSQQMQK